MSIDLMASGNNNMAEMALQKDLRSLLDESACQAYDVIIIR